MPQGHNLRRHTIKSTSVIMITVLLSLPITNIMMIVMLILIILLSLQVMIGFFASIQISADRPEHEQISSGFSKETCWTSGTRRRPFSGLRS